MRWKKAALFTLFTAIALGLTWEGFKKFINLKTHNVSYVTHINQLENEGAPDRVFEFEGKSLKLSEIDTPITLLHFWASWCAPCIDEFPHLMEMTEIMKDKVTLIAISLDESPEEYEAFLSSLKVKLSEHFIVLRDKDDSYAKLLGTEKLPETYVLDRNKKLVRKVPTAEKWASPQVIEFLNYVSEKQ